MQKEEVEIDILYLRGEIRYVVKLVRENYVWLASALATANARASNTRGRIQ